jgi:citrate synthase
MATLKQRLSELVPVWREEIAALNKEHGNQVISEVTISQAYGGMRGVKGMVCDTSDVPPDKGLIIRGIPIGELTNKLPEEVFYLLITGELPDNKAFSDLQNDLQKRAKVPSYVWKTLKAMPKDSHPMVMFNAAILMMERESQFRRMYDQGMKKTDYWIPMLEDSLNLIARLPAIGAGVYRMRFEKGARIPAKKGLDWAANYAHMLGIKDKTGEFPNLMRLNMVLHSDHESGNASAHACHCVGSTLSDAYYAVSAGLNGLAGPLHGLANQECLNWVLMVYEKFKGIPEDHELRLFAQDTLAAGKVIPGYGHAVLRITDPRFDTLRAFGQRVMPDDPIFQIVEKIFKVVPDVLKEQAKIKDPWPNVDAISGTLMYHYGLRELSYYTVLFSISRALGMCAQLVVNRAIGSPIERPKSVTTAWLKKQIAQEVASGDPKGTTEPKPAV